MQTIRFLKSVDGYRSGDIVTVENNHAHAYIDAGAAQKVEVMQASNRMVTPESKSTRIKDVKPGQLRSHPNA